MNTQLFLSKHAEERTGRAIESLEQTCALEIKVVVRHASSPYPQADYLAGFVAAEIMLFGLLWLPWEFPLWQFPLGVTLAFLAGAMTSRSTAPLRRIFVAKSEMQADVDRAAKAAFVDQRVFSTSSRKGVLVYVSLFERTATLVADIGVDVETLAADWSALQRSLSEALARGDIEQFAQAIEKSAVAIARIHPPGARALNELSNDVVV